MSIDNSDKAAQARQGLLDSVSGKVKEVAGSVTGNDDLTEEGQLQQAAARHRKEANTEEAIAGAKQNEATQELRESTREAAAERAAAQAHAHREEDIIERHRETEHVVADSAAMRQEASDREAAEQRADELAASGLKDAEALAADAQSTEQRAAADKSRLEREAAIAEQQAAQLRAETDK